MNTFFFDHNPNKKVYIADVYYHIMNRGGRYQKIFKCHEDFICFRDLLYAEAEKLGDEVQIEEYSLLPNHYHFLVYQKFERSIVKLMKSIGQKYTHFFRLKYEHSGSLCEGPYMAVPLRSPEAVEIIREYILKNPEKAGLQNWPYVGKLDAGWALNDKKKRKKLKN